MDEPNALLRWVMFHFAGGDALFAAILLLILISFVPEAKATAWRWTLVSLLPMVWGGLASPAWPLTLLIGIAALIVGWRALIHLRGRNVGREPLVRWSLRIALGLLVFGEVRIDSIVSKAPPQSLAVIADSITAGLNDGEVTWPQLFAERTGIAVRDASQPGATFKSAISQADAMSDDQTPLILEIGGNDLLGGLSLADFTRDCEQLCRKVCTPGRIIWMCELPLPPGKSQYGVAQRRIARKYDIQLIPKRTMMQLLTTAGATVDSIHLSPAGQNLFCELIQDATGCATRKVSSVRYEKIERRYNASAMRR